MYYVLLPQIQYSYEPHILSHQLLKACKYINKQSGRLNSHITFLIRTDQDLRHYFKNMYYYKDVKYSDPLIDYDRMLQLTRHLDPTLLNGLSFTKMTSVKSKQIDNGHPQNLRWNIQYEVYFSNYGTIQLNQLIHDCNVDSFYEMALHYCKSHHSVPIMFHDLKNIDFNNFDETMRVFHGAVDNKIEYLYSPAKLSGPDKFPFQFEQVSDFETQPGYGLHKLSRKDIPEAKKKNEYDIKDYQTKLF